MPVLRRLTIVVLKSDIGVLLPEAGAAFIGWLKYWKALPAASSARQPGSAVAGAQLMPAGDLRRSDLYGG